MNSAINDISTIPSDVPPKNIDSNIIIAKLDSAATNHYITENDKGCLSAIRSYSGPSVTQPDCTQLSPSEQGQLLLSNKLSKTMTKATILPEIKSSSLVSLRQICDDVCTVLFNRKKISGENKRYYFKSSRQRRAGGDTPRGRLRYAARSSSEAGRAQDHQLNFPNSPRSRF